MNPAQKCIFSGFGGFFGSQTQHKSKSTKDTFESVLVTCLEYQLLWYTSSIKVNCWHGSMNVNNSLKSPLYHMQVSFLSCHYLRQRTRSDCRGPILTLGTTQSAVKLIAIIVIYIILHRGRKRSDGKFQRN